MSQVGVDGAFPELDRERQHLAFARECRDHMIDRLERVDPSASADEITAEYVEMTVAEALDSLRSPGAGEFFGRIDEPAPNRTSIERWYIGRRHVENDTHDPVVVDWRAPISAPFYRATAIDPLGVVFRRRFTFDEGLMTAYLDEHLDDPDAVDVAAGIPDPVLAEIGAARSGAMREIVATIQAEQDIVIRAPIDQALIVQGGPGTGKTAVALHRAAYLLFEHRHRLARDGVLVVGPNRAFLDYIANVLPSLGERSVRQCTAIDLCIPKTEISAVDDVEAARWKGSADRLVELEQRALDAIQPPTDDVRVPIGARTHEFSAALIADWIAVAKSGVVPINQRRERLRVLAQQELLRRCGGDDFWSSAGPLKTAINACWPTQQPVKLVDRMLPGPSGRRRRWTPADQFLVDEANTLLNGTPFTYGHVVVDEAQDHSAVALRVIGRRSPIGSITMVGDVAQSTTPAGQERWVDVFAHLGAERYGRRPDDRLPGARAHPRHRQPSAPAHGRDGGRQPLSACRGRAARLARGDADRCRRGHRQGRDRGQAPPPTDRCGRAARTPRARRRRSGRRRADGGRSRPRTRSRRRAVVRPRVGEGSRVRRCGGRRATDRSSTVRREGRACCTWR